MSVLSRLERQTHAVTSRVGGTQATEIPERSAQKILKVADQILKSGEVGR